MCVQMDRKEGGRGGMMCAAQPEGLCGDLSWCRGR